MDYKLLVQAQTARLKEQDWATKDIAELLIPAASTGFGHLYYT